MSILFITNRRRHLLAQIQRDPRIAALLQAEPRLTRILEAASEPLAHFQHWESYERLKKMLQPVVQSHDAYQLMLDAIDVLLAYEWPIELQDDPAAQEVHDRLWGLLGEEQDRQTSDAKQEDGQ